MIKRQPFGNILHKHLLENYADRPFCHQDLLDLARFHNRANKIVTHALRGLEAHGLIKRTGSKRHNKAGGGDYVMYQIVEGAVITLKTSAQCQKETAERMANINAAELVLQEVLDAMTRRRVA